MNNLDLLVPKPHTKGDWWTWGTVTAVGANGHPSVRLDGESAALPSPVDSLVAGLSVNDRVWIQVSDNRVVVTGRFGGQVNDLADEVSALQATANDHESRLDAVETDDTGWQVPTLVNSWVDYGPATWGGAKFRRKGGLVEIRGLIKSGTSGLMFTLPAGFRPSESLIFTTTTFARTTNNASAGTAHTHDMPNNICRVDVHSDGQVTGGNNAYHPNWVSLSGVLFHV